MKGLDLSPRYAPADSLYGIIISTEEPHLVLEEVTGPHLVYLIWIELLSVDADEGHEDVAHGIIVDSLPWR